MLKRLFVIITLCFGFAGAVYATHNRAGEITYKRIAPFTEVVNGFVVPKYHYLITITKYTDHGNTIADRCVDTISFGDGERGIAARINGMPPGSTLSCSHCGNFLGSPVGCGELIINSGNYQVKLNTYTITHTYPGPGEYKIRSLDPNRNYNVENIPNSVNQPFYVESLLIINSFTGANSSPVFNFSPIDRACLSKCFEHNPGAFDPDDDSLSFEITTSRGYNGETVPGYQYPDAGPSGTYGINARTGLLSWCSPQNVGEYNIAFIVKEWRKNSNGIYHMIGYVLRDMQVVVAACPTNDPPVVVVPPDTCVEAGAFIEKTIWVSDPDADKVTLETGGGPFAAPAPVASVIIPPGTPTVDTKAGFPVKFRWQTTCDHIRSQEYHATFKGTDDGGTTNAAVKLVTFKTYIIKVVPPSIKNVTAVPVGSTIRVSWDLPECKPTTNPVVHFKIYRKNDCSAFVATPCKTGVDKASGFESVGEVPPNVNFFVDDNNGKGLVVGENYSYLVVAVYSDGIQTYASSSVCGKLKRDVPVILNVDVDTTSATNGRIFIRWSKPLTTKDNLDTVALPGPYVFNLVHNSSQGTSNVVFTDKKNFFSQLDTSFMHTGINTTAGQEEYFVQFIAGTFTVGSSQKASSVFLRTRPSDRRNYLEWATSTPWKNKSYDVLRKDATQTTFTRIATTGSTAYTDSTNIVNGNSYCYKVVSTGEYSDPGIFKPLINRSQEACATAKDTIAPVTPTLAIQSDCPEGYVSVKWDLPVKTYPNDDVGSYILYFKSSLQGEYTEVVSGKVNEKTFENLTEISGCYAVRAIDINGNAGKFSEDVCIDNCPIFELPNIFTPNGDGVNDNFQAVRIRQINDIELMVTDRWGNVVYRTKDPNFKWNGVSQNTKVLVAEGTYFYICDVFEPRLKGIVKRTLKGYVQVAR